MDEMDVELEPEQAPAVAEALAALLREERRPVDPWWQAGIDDALGT